MCDKIEQFLHAFKRTNVSNLQYFGGVKYFLIIAIFIVASQISQPTVFERIFSVFGIVLVFKVFVSLMPLSCKGSGLFFPD